KRMSIKDTRACINAILSGSINDSEFETTVTFRLQVPKTLDAVNPDVLNPRSAWADKDAFDKQRDQLAEMFIKNFQKYMIKDSKFDFSKAGPSID
ncbi:MAG: phosphoenolpyruvate carboxykinase (ATP), partial [Thiovulaceae bacterium]|nr:phosphoenolpyruvate carboxykinase (ATP) [Sulfurimonadaceae bacterium]